MVEVEGLEPPAPWSQTTCATKLRYTSIMSLYYIKLVAATGVEPVTFRVWTERSSHLSYAALVLKSAQMVPRGGIEPPTRGFSVLCSTDWAIWANMAERVGFEPTVPFGITGFQDQLLKPLGHLSKAVKWLVYYNSSSCFCQALF